MTGPWRIPSGGLIDRTRTCRFRFDGKRYTGHPGDTLASALLANGVKVFGRSFKYHRPRGLYTADTSEPNALVQLGVGAAQDPNGKATGIELIDGMSAVSQNRWPSLRFDAMAAAGWFAPLLSAGFYYKTFMWPSAFWEKLYEPLIRRAAGLGRLSGQADDRRYERQYAHCDLLVVGSGPAGLMAALTAGRAGVRVILAEEDFQMGGWLLGGDDAKAAAWLSAVVAELASLDSVVLLPRTSVFGVYDGGVFAALEQPGSNGGTGLQRYWKIIAGHAILATGAQERGIVFGGNDKPGVMLASAARSYAVRHAVRPGRRAVVFTATDDGWRAAARLAAAGVDIEAVVDPRDTVTPVLKDAVDAPHMLGAVVKDAHGFGSLSSVSVATRAGGQGIKLPCDLLAVSGGWSPNIGLTCHLGAKPRWDDDLKAFVPGRLPALMSAAGGLDGALSAMSALRSGLRAAQRVLSVRGIPAVAPDIPDMQAETTDHMPFWRVCGSRTKAFVDFQHDVTADDIVQAHREGFRAVEHVKRYTTLGMATDQGRTSNLNGLAILAAARGEPMERVGTTTYRPPHVPVAVGALAAENRGRTFRPVRLPPSHAWACEQGAVFVEAGVWLRARYFPKPGETHWRTVVDREVATVRGAVGFCDVSTLGKIDVFGPDAGVFLERLYINAWQKLAVGRARYGLMLREDGFAMDDGTTSRLRQDYYVMTTTTAQAGPVFQHMKFCHHCLWPDLDVQFVSVTDQWAQFALAGPQSRRVLAKLVGDDVSNEALPYMGVMETTVLGVSGRVFRLSFSGELAYEIAVPARYGDALARALMQVGAAFGICPYGTEALSVMRIEKGHVAGPELNGQTTARDLGLAGMMSKKKDFVGRRMALRPMLNEEGRPRLVGVKSHEPFQAGAHLLPLEGAATAVVDAGHVTSSAYSPTVRAHIGLGFLADADAFLGKSLRAVDPLRGRDTLVEVCTPVFVDPKGERVRA